MSSREQPSRLNFTNTRGRWSRLRIDYGNRFYFHWFSGKRQAAEPSDLPTTFPPNLTSKRALTRPRSFKQYPHQFTPPYRSSPAIWTGRAVPFTLQPDDGYVYFDQKNAQLAQYPMLPLFAAADAIHDEKAALPVDWPTVDVVTDRNGMRKLLRWLDPTPGRAVRDFRIDVQLVGNKTLVLRRWESPAGGGLTNRSYGHAFQAEMTRAAPDCPPRVITESSPIPDSSVATTSIDDSNLADAPSSVVAQQASTSTTTTVSPVIDILDWNELYPQMALSQTPTLRLGVHERGEFTELREWQLEGAGARVGTETTRQSGTQRGADRLAKLLQDVQKVAIARGPGPTGGFSLVCENGKLCVYARKMDGDDGKNLSGSCLPPEVAARFDTRMHDIL
ncbi:hypothetical protein EDB85DRAFT_2278742 [Lactarius pseudohatsudake]|nr:hypothetical protein EDB85DRAFT_2278742 [Lactarius pseudohatsudake]